ncbi:MAG: phosphatidate cytidylyltransferase [Betaproteobacteria bacterium]|nr:phosphatidate cytidylyltransferase [Betaproteobacteria bacterium]MDE2621996.1 phosphatidate cytidylyltransferase [Betaproteobacteria bacterium]
MLRARILTAILLLAVLAALLFVAPAIYWKAAVLLAALVASWEWGGLARFPQLSRVLYVVLTALLAWACDWLSAREGAGGLTGALYLLSLLFWCGIVPFWLARQWKVSSPALLAAVGWLLILPTAFALETLHQAGPWVLLMFMIVIWLSDSAAYFVGRAWGSHKLAPAISPGKTWEGVGGGLAAVLLYAAGMAFSGFPDAQAGAVLRNLGWVWMPLSLALAVLGILGDLFESWIKRCAGVKDSGRLLPGHGGILDRIDALTAALPLAAWVVMETGGWYNLH